MSGNAILDSALILGGVGLFFGFVIALAGRASRRGASLEVRHVAEVLADSLDEPAIGEPCR